jgi:hypothetical protein
MAYSNIRSPGRLPENDGRDAGWNTEKEISGSCFTEYQHFLYICPSFLFIFLSRKVEG